MSNWVCAGKASCMCNEGLIGFLFFWRRGRGVEGGRRKEEGRERREREDEGEGEKKWGRNHHRLCCCSGMGRSDCSLGPPIVLVLSPRKKKNRFTYTVQQYNEAVNVRESNGRRRDTHI